MTKDAEKIYVKLYFWKIVCEFFKDTSESYWRAPEVPTKSWNTTTQLCIFAVKNV